jgi:AraC-like DNA-binding protein/DNA-binding response OmpR family regulator/streptogramin lyase
MICCDIMHQQHTVWATEHIAQQHLRKSHSLKVFADQSDNIWLYGQGTLMMYNKSTNVWDTAIGNNIGLTSIAVDRSVNGMTGDNKGNIWIGTDRMGLLRMNVNSHEIESVQPHNGKSDQMTQETVGVQSVYVDDTDLLWIGTEKSGVAFYGDNIYKFQSTYNGDITAITQDSDGNVWYGTSDKGVIGYEGPLASQKVTCMEATTDGSVWVGSRQNGLTRIKDGSSHIFSVVRDSMKTLIDDHVNALAKDNSGNLWIATNGGLQVYNPKMDTFSSYTRENGMLSTNNITSLFYGKSNKLLIGTSEGLVILNLSNREKILLTGNSTNLKTFTNNYITQVFEDSRGLIWVGTREGLNVLNVVSDSLNYITEKQGLCNNSICGITEDRNSNMWITTSNGISRIVVQRNREEGTFGYGLYNYDTKDGLQSNEFNTGSILTKSDGTVLFGGLFGVNWVRQGAKMDQNTLPRVMLTQLFIGEEEVMVGHEYDGNVILAQALNESNKIYLKNKQNTFTIKFAAGNYNQGERLQFMYWMEGRDHDWRNGDALLHGVKFRDLGSGSYTLHVKAVSADGAVSNQERKLEINIERPWWLTWWMLTVYVILAIIALLVWRYGYKKFKNFLTRKRTVVEELKRQREEIKTTSDELRQPMARMTTIIGNLAERERDLEGREQLNSLHFQMLQVITRISEMQTILENPEAKAESTAKDRLELNDQGEVRLPSIATAELTANIQPLRLDKKTHKFNVVFIDSNKDFINFMNAHLHEVYDFHVYDDIRLAIPDIESLKADLVICKHDMKHMTGSELCNKLKSNPHTQNVKFVLMTDTVLTQEMMSDMNITLAADDYLAKPFNVQEAVMRFNKLMGLGPVEMEQNTIEGRETRMLEGHNASMTTATMAYDDIEAPTSKETETEEAQEPEQQKPAEEVTKQQNNFQFYSEDETIGDYSMSDMMDRQLMKNVEQYVLHNMSRGQISLEEMASSMGMGRVPFFHKIRSITTKTPAEVVREIRLKHACVLLTKTNINMSELAINIGFSTAENFINIFREKYGMTPLEYRLKYKK